METSNLHYKCVIVCHNVVLFCAMIGNTRSRDLKSKIKKTVGTYERL